MASVDITVRRGRTLQRIAAREMHAALFRTPMGRAIAQAAEQVREDIRRNTPAKTGRTRKQFVRLRLFETIGHAMPAARVWGAGLYNILEGGAKPHSIAAGRRGRRRSGKRVLAGGPSGPVFGTRAFHPGVKAYRMFAKAREALPRRGQSIVSSVRAKVQEVWNRGA
jgi:hypothetical protein